MHSTNQTSMRDIELSNGQITRTGYSDGRLKPNEISQENDNPKDVMRNEEITEVDKGTNNNQVEPKFDEPCEKGSLKLTAEQSEVIETDEASTSSNECHVEDCSPQKRREKRQRRRKRKSLMEILFV